MYSTSTFTSSEASRVTGSTPSIVSGHPLNQSERMQSTIYQALEEESKGQPTVDETNEIEEQLKWKAKYRLVPPSINKLIMTEL
jgi:hypothetical protein